MPNDLSARDEQTIIDQEVRSTEFARRLDLMRERLARANDTIRAVNRRKPKPEARRRVDRAERR